MKRIGIGEGVSYGLTYRATSPTDIPPGVDWDTWLGPVPSRPFTTGTIRMGWHPFSDICNGLIGNWGTHHVSAGWWALDLGAPSTIEVVQQTEWPVKESYPLGFVLKYVFPARGTRPEVAMYFHGGTKAPQMPFPRHIERGRPLREEDFSETHIRHPGERERLSLWPNGHKLRFLQGGPCLA